MKRKGSFSQTPKAKKPQYKRQDASGDLSRQVAAAIRANEEHKFVDFTVSGDAFTNVWAGGEMDDGTALSISGIAIGDAENQRDGRQVTMDSWFVKGYIQLPASEANAAPVDDVIARIAVVLDTQTNFAQMNAEDCFITIAAGQDVNSVKNLQYTKRFKVLKDKTFRLPVSQANMNEGAVNSFANATVIIPFKMGGFFNPPIVTNYLSSPTNGGIASIVDNSIHVIGTATSQSATLSYKSRVRFRG